MKYFGIFNNSGDVQTALNESALTKPYVALVSGVLDYNTVQPQSPNYIGEWSDDGEGNYTFQVTDINYSFWGDWVKVATSQLYYNGDLANIEFYLQRIGDDDEDYYWMAKYQVEDGEDSDSEEYELQLGDMWEINALMTQQGGSDCVSITNTETNDFVFCSNGEESAPLSLNTINPVGNYIGEWSDDGEGNYTFSLLNDDVANWGSNTLIARAWSLEYEPGDTRDMDVYISGEEVGSVKEWTVTFVIEAGDPSDPSLGTSYTFTSAEDWTTELKTGSGSDACVNVTYNGGSDFSFYSGDQAYPLSMDTINTVEPSGE